MNCVTWKKRSAIKVCLVLGPQCFPCRLVGTEVQSSSHASPPQSLFQTPLVVLQGSRQTPPHLGSPCTSLPYHLDWWDSVKLLVSILLTENPYIHLFFPHRKLSNRRIFHFQTFCLWENDLRWKIHQCYEARGGKRRRESEYHAVTRLIKNSLKSFKNRKMALLHLCFNVSSNITK